MAAPAAVTSRAPLRGDRGHGLRRGDGPAASAARAVAGRPGRHGQPFQVDQQLVGHVDRERRDEPGREHRAHEQDRPGRGRGEPDQRGQAAHHEDRAARDHPDPQPLLDLVGEGPGDGGGDRAAEGGDAQDHRQPLGMGVPDEDERRGRAERGRRERAVGGVPAERHDADDRGDDQQVDGERAQGVRGGAGGEPARRAAAQGGGDRRTTGPRCGPGGSEERASIRSRPGGGRAVDGRGGDEDVAGVDRRRRPAPRRPSAAYRDGCRAGASRPARTAGRTRAPGRRRRPRAGRRGRGRRRDRAR